MKPESRKEFDAALLKIAKLYGYELDKEQAELYFSILSDYTLDETKAALLICARTQKFFPKPSEIIEAMGVRKDNIEYDFQYCLSMVKELGFHDSVIMEKKLLMVVIRDLGGLQEFTKMAFKDEKDAYFKFSRAYNRRIVDEKHGDLPEITKLVGYMEQLANQNGAGTHKVIYWNNKIVKTISSDDLHELFLELKNDKPLGGGVTEIVNKLAGKRDDN